jgi:hypothetical protein
MDGRMDVGIHKRIFNHSQMRADPLHGLYSVFPIGGLPKLSI